MWYMPRDAAKYGVMVTHLSEAIVCQAVCGNVDGSNRITTNFTITFRHRPLGCLQGPQVSLLTTAAVTHVPVHFDMQLTWRNQGE